MIFTATALPGAFVIELTRLRDDRGSFARTFCAETFAGRGLCSVYVQCSTSRSARTGTLRGMHYQEEPHAEAKLVRVTQGAIHDVVLDLRANSPTYLRWFGVDLSADNGRMIYVPEGFAHGFQTLCDDVEVFYQMSRPYVPAAARGVRWDDPAFGIVWPDTSPRVIGERDSCYPNFTA